MIEWKGLYANTPYSSANNKTQDDAVVGMQDTIYVTGPGYGGYSANVRVHNESGAVVALIPVSGGGGALSAPAPVRILDDSTTYSYSLEVVRGAVPSDDADKIVIRIVGGASKRYPGQGSTLPDGTTSLAGPLRVDGDVVADGASFAGSVRVEGDLEADSGSFAGPVRAPGLLLSESADFDAWLSSRRLRCVGWGSSTMADASRPQRVNVRANTTDYSDCWNSFLVPAITRGIPFHLEWNGGVAGTSTTQILESIETDLADPTFPSPAGIDFAIIQPFANTITGGVDPYTEEKAVTEKVFDLLKRFPHWKIVLVVPHTQNPMVGTHLNYRHAQIALRRIADRNPSRIEVADHYGVLSPFGAETNIENLRDAMHLSVTGAAALCREWSRIARWLGFIPKAPFVLPSKSVIATISGKGIGLADGYSSLNQATIAGAAANEFGTPRWDITATGALGMTCVAVNDKILSASRPIVAGRLYRLYIDDMEIMAAADASSSFGPGAMVRGTSVSGVRWRSLQWFTQAVTYQQIPVGWRIQNYLGPIMRGTASMAAGLTLGIFPGDGVGAKIRLSFASLLEVPE